MITPDGDLDLVAHLDHAETLIAAALDAPGGRERLTAIRGSLADFLDAGTTTEDNLVGRALLGAVIDLVDHALHAHPGQGAR